MNSPDGFRVLCGLTDPLQAAQVPALRPFAPQVTAFLADLSASLLKNNAARPYPDVTAFGFFCRVANMRQLQKPYDDCDTRLGRGMVFHIAPGNVPMNFAYSLAASLLAGNANLVKAPSKAFAQTAIACEAMQVLLDGPYRPLRPYINVIEYPRERQDLTEAFSAACGARVIWGGDETIRRVRLAALPPRAFDITFADRWSMAVLNAGAVSRMTDVETRELAKGFYNDTYLFDQNACTSPRLCVWMGEPAALETAKNKFWSAVHAEATARYPFDAVTAVDKLTELYRAAAQLNGVHRVPVTDNRLTRIRLDRLSPAVLNIHCTGGCFLEYDAAELAEILPVLTEKTQTVACAGVDPAAVRALVIRAGAKGADRAVPVGRTMDFSLVWDGYDLIRCLSRQVG